MPWHAHERRRQRRDREIWGRRASDRPADDAPRRQVEHDGEITPSALQAARGHVCRPHAIHAPRAKMAPHAIGGNRIVVTTVGRHDEPPTPARPQSRGAHQSRDAFAADGNAAIVEDAAQSWAAIGLPTVGMGDAQLRGQAQIIPRVLRRTAARPRVKPAAGHAHTTTEQGDGILRLLRSNEAKPHLLCFAKKAVAFFRTSRSSRSCRFSARRRRFSATKSRLGTSPASSACFTHKRSVLYFTPSTRAKLAKDCVPSRACRIASSRNSFENVSCFCGRIGDSPRALCAQKGVRKIGSLPPRRVRRNCDSGSRPVASSQPLRTGTERAVVIARRAHGGS